MKPAPFDYLRIEQAQTAIDHLAQAGEDARILAGGQSLMPILNMRLAQPRLLLDVSACSDLKSIRGQRGALSIGAAVTQAELEAWPSLSSQLPLLHAAIPHISHFQIRNRGTVCGSLAHADPSAELPLCLSALGGEVVLRSSRGERVVPASDFFLGTLVTARRADELLVEARFPLALDDTGYAFDEFSIRHGDYAIVALAGVVNANEIRLAVGGVADSPKVRQWPTLHGSDLDDALNEFAWSLDARDDAQASAAMRRHLVRQLGTRVIARAHMQRTQRGHSPLPPGEGRGVREITPAPVPHPNPSPGGRGAHLPAVQKRDISLMINNAPRTGAASSRTLLSDFLRHELGMTGTHVGCEHGVCGACTIRIDGIAQRACLTLALQAEGRDLQTIESANSNDSLLARLRASFKRHHALQCGYCTAGILMSCADFLRREPHPDEAAVRAMLSGHLCRCTGYTPIVAAILDVAHTHA